MRCGRRSATSRRPGSSYRACVEAADNAIALLRGDASPVLARSYVQLLNALENLHDPRANEVRPQAVAAARAARDDACIWYLLCNDALQHVNAAAESGLDAAQTALAEALDIAERMRRTLLVTATRSYLARLDGRRGRFARAREGTRAAIRAQRALLAETYVADNLVQLAWFARECGDLREARAAAVESIEIASRLEYDSVLLAGIDELAAALDADGHQEPAAVLRGYAQHRTALLKGHRPYPEHVARHAALGNALRTAHPAAYARGERAEPAEITALLRDQAAATER